MKGSCLCGALHFDIALDALGDTQIPKGLCHCDTCKKISGSAFSSNIIVPDSVVTLHGTPKQYTLPVTASGLQCDTYFCDKCGSTIMSRGQKLQGMSVIKVGCLDIEGDDQAKLELWTKTKPDMEIFCRSKIPWAENVEGTKLVDAGL